MTTEDAHAHALEVARARVAETDPRLAATAQVADFTRPGRVPPARGPERERWLALARGRQAYQVAYRRALGVSVLGPLPDEARRA